MNQNEAAEKERECPECCHGGVRSTPQLKKFMYGDPEKGPAIELAVTVPVWSCGVCGLAFTVDDAEELIDAAVRSFREWKAKA